MNALFVLLLLAPPITSTEYQQRLEIGVTLFEGLPSNEVALQYAEAVSPSELTSVDGTKWTVRDAWLEDAVRQYAQLGGDAREERADDIAKHLELRIAQLDPAALDTEQPATASGEAPSPETLTEILQAEAYQSEQHPPELVQAAAKVRKWLNTRWEDVKAFFRRLFGNASDDQSWWETLRGLLTLLASVVALGVLLYFIGRALADNADLGVQARGSEDEMPLLPPEAEPMAAEASRRAQAGDLRAAMRSIYLALLGRLHERGLIRYDRHRTNREYVRDLRTRPRVRDLFTEAVDVFDPTWYGHLECTQEQFDRMQEIFDALAEARERAA